MTFGCQALWQSACTGIAVGGVVASKWDVATEEMGFGKAYRAPGRCNHKSARQGVAQVNSPDDAVFAISPQQRGERTRELDHSHQVNERKGFRRRSLACRH